MLSREEVILGCIAAVALLAVCALAYSKLSDAARLNAKRPPVGQYRDLGEAREHE